MDFDTLTAGPPRRVPLRDHHPGRLPEHRRRRTSSRWSAPPRTSSGSARARPRTWGSSTSTAPPARRSTARAPRAARSSRGPKTATVIADPVVNGIHAWSRRSPFEAPATRQPDARARPRALGALAPVPQPGAAHRLRRRGERRAASLARRHVPHPPGAGRVLAGRESAGPRRRPGHGQGHRRRADRLQRLSASGARSGSGRWPPPVPGSVDRGPDPSRLRALRRPFHLPQCAPSR